VILGFTTGAAILIIASQLPKTLGVTNQESNVLVRALASLRDPNWLTEAIVLSMATAAFVLGGRRIHRLFPSIFIAMIGAIIYSTVQDYQGPTVGDLPGGFISFNFQLPWQALGKLLFPGIIMAFIGFAEPASISMALMEEEKREWSANQELCGGGLANLASGLIGGYPIGGSFSRTSVNKFAGADTSWSGFITGAVILSLLWLTPYLKHLPDSAIGAVVIVAVIRLIKLREIWDEFKSNKVYGCVAVITLVATLATAPRVDFGIAIGAAVGIAVTIWEKSTGEEKAEESNV
jgi:SulP family sulfate permease